MSTKLGERTKAILSVIVACVAVMAAFSSWAIIPYRLNAAERSIHTLQVARDDDHTILIRIDERLQLVLKELYDKKTK